MIALPILLDFVAEELYCHGRRIKKHFFYSLLAAFIIFRYLDRWYVTSICTLSRALTDLRCRPGYNSDHGSRPLLS